MLMKSKINLKVVDNEGAFLSEASLGRSDWECKPEEDSSSAASRSLADHHSSNGSDSFASFEDGNTSSSS